MSARERSARKRRPELSQHFLRDAIAAKLVRSTSICRSDLVVEIGPGRGALTEPLSARAGRLIAVELDPYLADRLRQRYAGRAEIISGDFLAWDPPGERHAVIGNIPYAVSMDVVRKIVECRHPPDDVWLIVQREFAHRLCGPPYARESLASLRLKPFWSLEIRQRLARDAFVPPPSVASAFLHLSRRPRPLIDMSERADYLALLEMGFRGQPTLRQALKPRITKVQLRRLAADFHFSDEAGPADLIFEQWLGIHRFAAGALR